MPRSYKKVRKRRTAQQVQSIAQARALARQISTEKQASAAEELVKNDATSLKSKAHELRAKYWNERRRAHRLFKTNTARKQENRSLKVENIALKRAAERLSHDLSTARVEFCAEMQRISNKVNDLRLERQTHLKANKLLRRQQQRLCSRIMAMKERDRRSSKRGRVVSLMRKGAYTVQARAIARYLVKTGTAERHVGHAIKHLGGMLGMEVKHVMSRRTVQRAILEEGVASDVQLGFEMAKSNDITYSSDSTSHRHIEYESRTIALKVIDYNNPNSESAWKMRTLGVGTSVDHTSETQLNGLRDRLHEIEDIFNNIPLAKRMGLTFNFDDFLKRLAGTTGDHAADQKKSHQTLGEWKMDVILRNLGLEAMLTMTKERLASLLVSLKLQQVEEIGGWEKWNALTVNQQEDANLEIIRNLGQTVLDNLPPKDQECLSRFIRTGCCMHKDLNTVKGGDKAMQDSWMENGRHPPILLANKDNAAVLTHALDPGNPTPAEKRAAEVSKRGGSHAAMLGGLICRNKDKKKGQQDSYLWYMQVHVGHPVPYPDVSNTRYGSHGDAAATIIVYLQHFISFMELVRDSKEKVGHTNIEKNFYAALANIPTLTELCVLALYHVLLSRPFMEHVRSHDNILDLGPYFQKKVKFLRDVISNPGLWTSGGNTQINLNSSDAPTIILGSNDIDHHTSSVLQAVSEMSPQLPDLNLATVAFFQGAERTFVERFSDEFAEDGPISKLTVAERSQLFFASTNDVNEGALGSWRCAQRRKPSETLHKFSAGFSAKINGTEEFHGTMLSHPEDERYLMKVARQRDKSGIARKMKAAQIQAEQRKVAANHEKENRRVTRQSNKKAAIDETAKHLILDVKAINTELPGKTLTAKLNFYRDYEEKLYGSSKNRPGDNTPRVPPQSQVKRKELMVPALQMAVQRYIDRMNEMDGPSESMSGTGVTNGSQTDLDAQDGDDHDNADLMYESDHRDDYA